MVQRILIATIDERTTFICLDAHGQVDDENGLFHTLNGTFESPPFHWWCRSVADIWTEGMYDPEELKREALAELQKRQEQQGLEKVTKKIESEKKLKPPSVEAQLQKADLNVIVDELQSGKIDLDQVPSERLDQVLEVDSLEEGKLLHGRFRIESNGGGISESWWVTDERTGKRYILKRGQYHNEAVNEVVVAEIQKALGFDHYPGARFVGAAEPNGWVLVEHVENIERLLEEGWRVAGTAPGHGRIGKLPLDTWRSPEDPFHIVMNDFMFDGADRKGGNVLRLVNEAGQELWVPIDNSLSLMGWRGAAEAAGDWSLAARVQIDDMRSYIRGTRGSPKGLFEAVGRMDGETVARMYDAYVDRWSRVDLDAVFAGLRSGVRSSAVLAHLDEVEVLIRSRVAALTANRSANLAAFKVPVEIIERTAVQTAVVGRSVVSALPDFDPEVAERLWWQMTTARGWQSQAEEALIDRMLNDEAAVRDALSRFFDTTDPQQLDTLVKTIKGHDLYRVIADDVHRFIETWAITSGGNDPLALAVQKVMAERWGAGGSAFSEYMASKRPEVIENTQKMYEKFGVFIRSLQEAIEAETQETLRSLGIDAVHVARGLNLKPDLIPDSWKSLKVGESLVTDEIVMNPLTSWSTRMETAERFASGLFADPDERSFVIEAVVPADAVFSWVGTGYGTNYEREIVLKAISGRFRVRRTR